MMAILWVCFECLLLACLYVAILVKHPEVPLFAKCGVFVVFVECCFFFVTYEFPEVFVKLVHAKKIKKDKK